MNEIRFAAVQEGKRILQDPFRLLLLLAPWIALTLSLLVYSERVVREVNTGIVDLDQSSLSRSLVRALHASPQVFLQQFPHAEAMQKAFREGRIRGGVLLPAGLSETVRKGKTGRVVVWRDASNPLYSNQVFQAASAVVAIEGAKLEAPRLMAAGVPFHGAKDLAMLVRVDGRPLGNPFVDYLRNMAPGLVPVFLQLCLMLAGGNLLPRHWTECEHPRKEWLGRGIPWILLQGGASLGFFLVLFPRWGIPVQSPLLVSLLLLLLLCASLCFGAALARILSNPLKTAQNLLAFNTPALLFSGYTFPEWAMPAAMEWATRPLPFSLFVDAYRGITGAMGARASVGWIGLAAYLVVPLVVLLWPKGRARALVPHPLPAPVYGEFRRIWKTPGLALLLVFAPLLYLAIYGALFSAKEESELPLAVCGKLDTQVERQLVLALDAHSRLQVQTMESAPAMRALQRGEVRGVLELPRDFDRNVRLRHAMGVPLLIPANRFLPVSDLQRAVGEVFASFSMEFRVQTFLSRGVSFGTARDRAEALRLEDHPLFNPRETYGDFMLPGLGVLILHQLMLLSMAFATACAVRTARKPGDLGSLWKRGGLYTAWFGFWLAVWFTVGLQAFQVPMDRNGFSLFLLAVPGLVSAGALGAVMGLLFRGGMPVLQLMAFTSYPFFFLSGASWPREAMPPWLDVIGQVLPLRPWMLGSGRAFRMDASWGELQGELLHLAVLSGIYLALAGFAWWVWKRRLAIFQE